MSKMPILDVYLDGQPKVIGTLASLENTSASFRYSEEYLGTPGAMPISLSLPLDEVGYGDAETRAFFDNLLPENDQMRRVMDLHRIERGDIVAILGLLGADCSGAISCVPSGSGPVKNPGVLQTDYDRIDYETLTDLVTRMANGRSLPDEIRDPSPVAGYQQKMALARLEDASFALPRTGTGAPTTHILKTPRIRDARDAVLERTSALLASRAGLDCVVPERLVFGGHACLSIERYDRTVTNGIVRRLHQEDFAQALGLPASFKYERNGTEGRVFDAAAVFGLLLKTATPVRSISNFLKLTLFNACVGNADNHAKNHALLYVDGPSPHLAPAYDLLPTRLDPALTSEMGFRIGTAATSDDIGSRDAALLLETFALSPAAATRFAKRQIAPLMQSLDEAAADQAFVPKDLADLIYANLVILSEAFGLHLDLRDRDTFHSQGGGWL
jgi:serine/threonine-protein kinase HipA